MDVGQIHILVVDDCADAADSTVQLLSLWGYDARACYDGATALESARAHRPDAVLLDLAMPRMDGFRFAQMFRELPLCEAALIIAISGYTEAAYRARAWVMGIEHYLLKPADPMRLRELLVWEIAPSIHAPLFDRVDRPRWPRPGTREPVLV
jgi:CheY-like chemotaxis protein